MPRHNFNQSTKNLLAQRVGYRCSNPACGVSTIGPSTAPDKKEYTGVAAHIHSASIVTGPRAEPVLTAEERESPENGIHLCNKCSTMIDKNNGVPYPPTVLHGWKRSAEAAARGRTYQNRPYNIVTPVVFSNLEQQYATALTCTGLNERNVLSCPSDQNVMRDVVNKLHLAKKCIVAGPSGTGKTLLTYQISYHFHLNGRHIFKLNKDWISTATILAAPTTSSLIIIDDAQTIETSYLETLLGAAHADCLVLANLNTSTPFTIEITSTFPTVHIVRSTQVRMIRQFCIENKSTISENLRSLGLRVKSNDIHDCIESRIDRAATEPTPWLFNYNLTESWRTAKNDYDRLRDDDDLHVVLLTVAILQYVTLDLGVSLDVIIDTLRRYKDEEAWLERAGNAVSKHCVLTDGRVRNKHYAYSRRILEIFVSNCPSGADYDYLTSLLPELLTTAAYERGHANLLEFTMFDFPQLRHQLNAEGFTTTLAYHLLQKDANITPTELNKLTSLVRINPKVVSVLRSRTDLLVHWLFACSKDTAYPLAHLLNELVNADFGPLDEHDSQGLLDYLLAVITSAEPKHKPRYAKLLNRLYLLLNHDDRNYISTKLGASKLAVDVPPNGAVVECQQFSEVLNNFQMINENWADKQLGRNVQKIGTLFNGDFATAFESVGDLLSHYFGGIRAILGGFDPPVTVKKHGRELTRRLDLTVIVESFERVTAAQLQRYCDLVIFLALYNEKRLRALSDRFPYSRLEALFLEHRELDHYHRALVSILRNPASVNWQAHVAWLIRSVDHVEHTFFAWDEILSLQRVADGVRYQMKIHMCSDCEGELGVLKYILKNATASTFQQVVRDNKGVLTAAICSETQNSDDHRSKFDLLLFLLSNSEFMLREMFEKEGNCKNVLDKVERLLHGKKWEKLIGRLYTTLVKEYGATCGPQVAAIERRFSSARDFDVKEFLP